MASFLEMLFGCSHKSFSFPISKRHGQRGPAASTVTGTYVVCLDCGKEFPYDWQQMKMLEGSAVQAKALQAKPAKAA
jgi:hypothetical protein